MKTNTQILLTQMERGTKMSKIIGRYKGGMEVFANQIMFLALNSRNLSQDARNELFRLAESMDKLVTENEQLWEEMNSSTEQDIAARKASTANDVVELERVQSDIVELERA